MMLAEELTDEDLYFEVEAEYHQPRPDLMTVRGKALTFEEVQAVCQVLLDRLAIDPDDLTINQILETLTNTKDTL